MMQLEQIKTYIHRTEVTQEEIAESYIGENGKSVTRNYINQLLSGKNELNPTNYRKLIVAINKAHFKKFNKNVKEESTILIAE